MEHVASQVIFSAALVNATASVESPILDLSVGPGHAPYTVMMKAASAGGTADVQLQYHTSADGVNFDHYDDNVDIVNGSATARPAQPEGTNSYLFSDFMNRFVQFKVTGVGSNPADTLVDATLLWREFI